MTDHARGKKNGLRRSGRWSGISGDYFHGRFAGADFSLVTNEWLDRNIRRNGPLGAEYPRWEYLMDGDTPSFLNLIRGLDNLPHAASAEQGQESRTRQRAAAGMVTEVREFYSDPSVPSG